MNRYGFIPLALLWLGIAAADPIHAIADGAYWHHDSGWVFPEKVAGFVRVGAAQDVAGSQAAIAYYARESEGVRLVVSVEVYPEDGKWKVRIEMTPPASDPRAVELLNEFVKQTPQP